MSGASTHGGLGKLLREKSLRAVDGSLDGLEEDGEIGRSAVPSNNFRAAMLLSSSSCLRKRLEMPDPELRSGSGTVREPCGESVLDWA